MKSLLVDALRQAKGIKPPEKAAPPAAAPVDSGASATDMDPAKPASPDDSGLDIAASTIANIATDCTTADNTAVKSMAESVDESVDESVAGPVVESAMDLDVAPPDPGVHDRGPADDFAAGSTLAEGVAEASVASGNEGPDSVMANPAGAEPPTAAASVADYPIPDPPVADPALVLPALSTGELELAEESPLAADAMPTADTGPESVSVPMPPASDRILVLARWSPVLCLLTLSAAAGSLVVYQNMTAQHPGYEMDMTNVSAPVESQDVSATPKWLEVAESNAAAVVADDVGVNAAVTDVAMTAGAPSAANGHSGSVATVGSLVTAAGSGDAGSTAYASADFDDLRRAYRAFHDGQFALAEQLYRRVLGRDAYNAQALSGLAAVLQRGPQSGQAISLYKRLLAIEPHNVAAAASLAALEPSSNSTDVETRLRVLLQQSPNSSALHFALGLRYAGTQRWPEAYHAFSNARELEPGNADYSFNAAISAQRLGRRDTARELYAQALNDVSAASLVDRTRVQQQIDRLSATAGAAP